MTRRCDSYCYLRSARSRRSRANWNMRLKSYFACKILIRTSHIQPRIDIAPIVPVVPISLGELIDKITILEVKKERIKDSDKLAFINLELDLLSDVYCDASGGIAWKKNKLDEIKRELKVVNEKLWDIEDSIRESEKNRDWASNQTVDHFIILARSVYHTNDERAKLKLKINNLIGSTISEVKSYSDY